MCSGCRNMFYCSKDCQRQDWKVHKHECKAFYCHGAPDFTRRMLFRLFLTMKHSPEKRTQRYKIPGTDPPQYRTYDDLRTFKEAEIKKDKKTFKLFKKIFEDFHFIGIDCKAEEIFDCLCKHLANSFIIENSILLPVGASIFVLESIFEHSCVPNADLIFHGAKLEVRAIKKISPGEKITVGHVDFKYSRDIRKKMFQNCFITCSCSRCTDNDEEGKFLFNCFETFLFSFAVFYYRY